jgi:transcriptional regulator with XRE-family HTH domain
MGRPTFKIDQVRLRGLREEKGMTQLALAKKVAQRLGTPAVRSDQSLVRHYQRIEEKGNSSCKYAEALATVLGVSMPQLQGHEGPDPYYYLQHIQSLLKDQLDTGTNQALQDLLEYHAKDDEENALKYLAEDIAEHIEQVQLARNPDRIKRLIQLTGLPEADLLSPANVRGFWFIAVRSPTYNGTEIIDGASAASFRIGEIMQGFLQVRGNDSVVRMRRDKPWIRIKVDCPRLRHPMYIDATRCQPAAKGLLWIDSSWRDELFIELPIISSAYAHADVVTDFSGKTSPSDLHRLRLIVTEHDGTYEKECRRMVVRGGIDELPETVKENFAKEGSSRILFMSWLTAGLKDALMPHLAARPASGWHVSANGTAVDIKLKNPRYTSDFFGEIRYRITLAEEVGHNAYDRVPVREKDLAQLQLEIEGWLAKGYSPTGDDEPLPDFEPL